MHTQRSQTNGHARVRPLLAAVAFAGLVVARAAGEVSLPAQADVQVAFDGECETLLLAGLDGARTEILVAIYTLTRHRVAAALVRARQRGVEVQVKYDAAEAQEEKGMRVALGVLRHAGIRCTPVKRSEKRAAMHNKFAVVDRKLVLTGSYNYTSAGTLSNDENLVSIRSEAVAEAFRRRFLALKDR